MAVIATCETPADIFKGPTQAMLRYFIDAFVHFFIDVREIKTMLAVVYSEHLPRIFW